MPHQYPHLARAFEDSVVLKKGNYPYPISPFSGVNPITAEMLKEIKQRALTERIFSDSTLLITFESAGNQLAAVVSQALNIPYLMARKKSFALSHEITFSVTTNFDEKSFYLYGDIRNEKIVIIDDVVASGTTLKNAALALQKAGAKVEAFFIIAAKNNLLGKRYQDTLSEINIPLVTMVQIQVVNDKVLVLD